MNVEKINLNLVKFTKSYGSNINKSLVGERYRLQQQKRLLEQTKFQDLF